MYQIRLLLFAAWSALPVMRVSDAGLPPLPGAESGQRGPRPSHGATWAAITRQRRLAASQLPEPQRGADDHAEPSAASIPSGPASMTRASTSASRAQQAGTRYPQHGCPPAGSRWFRVLLSGSRGCRYLCLPGRRFPPCHRVSPYCGGAGWPRSGRHPAQYP